MLAQAQECVWQWAVMGAVTIRISIGLPLAPTSRSPFKRDNSEACRTGGVTVSPRCPFSPAIRHRSYMMPHDWQFGMLFLLSGTRYRL